MTTIDDVDFEKMKGWVPIIIQNADASVRNVRGISFAGLETALEKKEVVYASIDDDLFCGYESLKIDCDGDAILAKLSRTTGNNFIRPLMGQDLDKLWTVVVQDVDTSQVLTLAYANSDAIKESLTTRLATYTSRTRGRWVKGESSGNTQNLVDIMMNTKGDALLYRVNQQGDGACHNKMANQKPYWSCFYRSLMEDVG